MRHYTRPMISRCISSDYLQKDRPYIYNYSVVVGVDYASGAKREYVFKNLGAACAFIGKASKKHPDAEFRIWEPDMVVKHVFGKEVYALKTTTLHNVTKVGYKL